MNYFAAGSIGGLVDGVLRRWSPSFTGFRTNSSTDVYEGWLVAPDGHRARIEVCPREVSLGPHELASRLETKLRTAYLELARAGEDHFSRAFPGQRRPE